MMLLCAILAKWGFMCLFFFSQRRFETSVLHDARNNEINNPSLDVLDPSLHRFESFRSVLKLH